MMTTRTMLFTPAISRFDRGTMRKARGDRSLLIAAALFLAVLIADAVFIANAASSLAEVGSLYVTVT